MTEPAADSGAVMFAYTEREATALLHMKSERALADYRRAYLKIGEHYSKIGRTVLYTPEQLRAILSIDRKKGGAA